MFNYAFSCFCLGYGYMTLVNPGLTVFGDKEGGFEC